MSKKALIKCLREISGLFDLIAVGNILHTHRDIHVTCFALNEPGLVVSLSAAAARRGS